MDSPYASEDDADIGEGLIEFEEAEAAELEDENGEIDVSKLVNKDKKLADLPSQKKRVMRPIPKLDEERLCSEKGVSMLPGLFQNVQFKGNGHEAEDLNYMMGILEYWAHRLMPSMTFDGVLKRTEQLGKKRRVQLLRHKLRHGLPVNNEEFIDEEVLRAEEEEDRNEQKLKHESAVCGAMDFEPPPLPDLPAPPKIAPTSEQLAKIEANKRRAMQLREERRLRELNTEVGASDALSTPFRECEASQGLLENSLTVGDVNGGQGSRDVEEGQMSRDVDDDTRSCDVDEGQTSRNECVGQSSRDNVAGQGSCDVDNGKSSLDLNGGHLSRDASGEKPVPGEENVVDQIQMGGVTLPVEATQEGGTPAGLANASGAEEMVQIEQEVGYSEKAGNDLEISNDQKSGDDQDMLDEDAYLAEFE